MKSRRTKRHTQRFELWIALFSVGIFLPALVQYVAILPRMEGERPVISYLGDFANTHHRRQPSTSLSNSTESTSCMVHGEYFTVPPVPHFIIPGAQKSGTSALYEFLNEHPALHGSPNFETHFFDWYHPADDDKARVKWLREHNFSSDLSEEDYHCALKKVYADNFLPIPDGSQITFEKTPSYLFLRRVPELIHSLCPWTKIVIILRNPIERAFSHYRMAIRTYNQSFEELVDQEIETMQKIGLSNAPSRDKQYTENDQRFNIPNLTQDLLDRLHWKHYRRRFANNYLQRSMYAPQIHHWMNYFPLHDKMLVVNYERFASNPQQVYNQILSFVGAGPYTPKDGFETKHNTKKKQNLESISPDLRSYLVQFFRPYNDQLATLLGEDWRNVWD